MLATTNESLPESTQNLGESHRQNPPTERDAIDLAVKQLQTYPERQQLVDIIIKLFEAKGHRVEDVHNDRENEHGLDFLLESSSHVDGIQVKTEPIRTAGAMKKILNDAQKRVLTTSHSRRNGERTRIGCLYWITSGTIKQSALDEYARYIKRSRRAVAVRIWSGFQLAEELLKYTPEALPELYAASLTSRAWREKNEGALLTASRTLARAALAYAKVHRADRATMLLEQAEQWIGGESDKSRYFTLCLGLYYRGLKSVIKRTDLTEVPVFTLRPRLPQKLRPIWRDIAFAIEQLDQLRAYSFNGLTGLRVSMLLQRAGLPRDEPIIRDRLVWVSQELREEDAESIDNQCSLCTGAAASCLVLARREDADQVLRWLANLKKYGYICRDPEFTRKGRHEHGMHYTAAVLEAFVDAYGPKAPQTKDVLRCLLTPRPDTASLIESWVKFADAPVADVAAELFPPLLRFRCAGGEFSAVERTALAEALEELANGLRKDAIHVSKAAFWYPIRENFAALVLADDVAGINDLMRHVLHYLRSRANSVYLTQKLRRRLVDSDAGRTAGYMNAWLSLCELELGA